MIFLLAYCSLCDIFVYTHAYAYKSYEYIWKCLMWVERMDKFIRLETLVPTARGHLSHLLGPPLYHQFAH